MCVCRLTCKLWIECTEKGNSQNIKKNGFVFYDYPYVTMKPWN